MFPKIDEMTKKTKNKFLLSNAVAQRAKEIADGSIPYIDDFSPNSVVETAMKEFAGEKLSIKVLEGPAPKPIKVIEAKAKDFWTIDNLERKEHKKTKKQPSKKK